VFYVGKMCNLLADNESRVFSTKLTDIIKFIGPYLSTLPSIFQKSGYVTMLYVCRMCVLVVNVEISSLFIYLADIIMYMNFQTLADIFSWISLQNITMSILPSSSHWK
jgi:hypothetical protein